MYTWKKRLMAAILAGCLSVGLMTPAFAVEGEGTQPTTTPEVTTSVAPTDEVDAGFSVEPGTQPAETSPESTEEPAATPSTEPSAEPTETPAETPSTEPSAEATETPAETPSTEPSAEPSESTEITEIPEETVPGAADPGFTAPDYANMSTEELYAAVKDMSAEDRAVLYSLLTEEQIAALEAYEQQQAQAALEAAYPAIAPQTVSGEDGVSVTVSAPVGAFPAGTTVTIEPVTAPNPLLRALSLEEDKKAVVEDAVAEAFAEEPAEPQQTVAFDITFWLDGQEIQPRDGYTVSVSFEVPNDSALLNGANQLQVFHLEESEDAEPVAQPVGEPVEIDTAAETQEIAVEAESFSVYALAAAVRANDEIIVGIGETRTISGTNAWYTDNHNWTVTESGIIELTSNNGSAEVKGIQTGVVTLTHTWREWWSSNKREEFTVRVELAVEIKDEIISNGCFVANLTGASDTVTYKWLHSDTENGSYSEVKAEALNPAYAVANGVNVAVDDGARMWYKVQAYDSNGALIAESAPKQVSYYDAIQNGSFEEPRVTEISEGTIFAGTRYAQIPQDKYENLYWKTTAIDSKVEMVDGATAGGGFGVYDGAADGQQFAELNCQYYGSLYQDVLTAPGAELYWSLMHRGRQGTDTMYVVIMSTEKAQEMNIQSQNDVMDVIQNPEAYQASVYEVTSETGQWKAHSGTYQTVAGQYLTRFFFVAYSAAGGEADGNLLDAVSFSDQMPYTIEYYVDGNKRGTKTGNADPYTYVTADLTGYEEYALDRTTLNDNDHNGSYSMFMGPGEGHTLRLYFVSTGITVTKNVTGLSADLTEEELEALLSNYQATFELYDAVNQKVAVATVQVNALSRSGSALFMKAENLSEKFVPEKNAVYTVKETSYGTILGYAFVEGNDDQQLSMGSKQAATVTFNNNYRELPKSADLTIEKQISGGGKPDQSFIFEITGAENFKMTVVMNPDDFNDAGYCEVTIKDLPAGTYTVKELQNWSWKYSATNETCNVTIDGAAKTASFTNTKKDDTPWLGGSDSVENVFATTGGTSTRMLSDMNPAAQATYPRNTGENTNGNDDGKDKDENTEPDPSQPMDTQEGGVSNV